MKNNKGLVLTLAIVVFLALIFSSIGKTQENLPAKIDKAIEKGVAWLKGRQVKDGSHKGSWGKSGGPTYPGKGEPNQYKIGITAFSLYALLVCGVPPDDQVIKDGFDYIHNNIGKLGAQTYERAALLMALEALADAKYKKKHPPKKGRKLRKKKPKPTLRYLTKEHKKLAGQQVKFFEKTQSRRGGWRYSDATGKVGAPSGKKFDNPHGVNEDISATQFVLLGLKAAVRLGLKVEKAVFSKALKYNLEEQEKDGPIVRKAERGTDRGVFEETQVMREFKARGWAYCKASPETREQTTSGSMTTAGVCSLIICKSELMETKFLKKELSTKLDQGILDGVAWLIHNYTVETNPNGYRGHYYYLYGLERVGVLGGFTYIGNHNWYINGAQLLVDQQASDGYWDTKTEVQPCDVLDTDYALLFLKKATKPVIGIESTGEK